MQRLLNMVTIASLVSPLLFLQCWACVLGQYDTAVLVEQSVNRQFNSSYGWDNASSNSQLVTDARGNTRLLLRGEGGWSQFFPLNGAADFHLISIQARRTNLTDSSQGWSGFGVTYYDDFFNTIDVVSHEFPIEPNTLPFSDLRYEVSTAIPSGAIFANIWVWNSNDATKTLVDEFSIANYFPDNEIRIDDGIETDPRQPNQNLIANGTFQQFGRYLDGTNVELSGTSFWNVSSPTNESGIAFRGGYIQIGARAGATSLWQDIEIIPGATYELSVDVLRRKLQRTITNNGRPWAAIGVDFYDEAWQFLSKSEISVNDVLAPAGADLNAYFRTKSQTIVSPQNARHASVWVWIEGSGTQRFVPLVVRGISLRATNTDTDPPTASVNRAPITAGGSTQIGFDLVISEPSGLGANVPGPEAIVTGPNGFEQPVQVLRSLGIGPGTTLLLCVVDAPGGQLDSEDNGVYTVSILDGQIQDIYGNFMPQQAIGTVVVDIP